MGKGTSPVYRPLSGLGLADVSHARVRLQSDAATVELIALTPDLFRFRATSRRQFSGSPSWAVFKTQWPAVTATVVTNSTEVAVSTAGGRLAVRLADGAWDLSDSSGRQIFESISAESGLARQGCNVTLTLTEGEAIFGLGETTGTFNKRGLIREFWNTDVLGHAPAIHPGLRSLYVSIPFAISLRGGKAAGLFWDNPARQTWDVGQTRLDRWQMRAASGEIDLYLFVGANVGDVVSRYTELTGRIPLPPSWALGFHQCRYSYESRSRVEEVAREFRRRKIPCDALYLDIHHMDGYRVFTFGKSFPAPKQMISKLARQGFKVVTIVDPGVKDNGGFGVLRRGRAFGAFVKTPDGKRDYVGRVWPGRVRFPDFLNAATRAWWGEEQGVLSKLGVAGFWNDMNEPANFALPTKTLPEDCLHRTDFGPRRHGEVHNIYGMQMARASREGALKQNPGCRPFAITRAGYAGVQRHALVWTGDNSSSWEHVSDTLQMCLNLGLSGVAFCGADVGGFLDNATPELLVRWTQMAAFAPFFRNHSNIGTIDQEPWSFGPAIEKICRWYIELRYQLLPYLYGLFAEARRSGTPIMRPLFWHAQGDPRAIGVSDQFLLGPDLMVAPVLRQGADARSVYLPRGVWYNFWTGTRHAGGAHVVAEAPLETIPLFVRAGGIIPMCAVAPFIGAPRRKEIILHLWPGSAGERVWYEDDGASLAYETGSFLERSIRLVRRQGETVIQFGATAGSYASRVIRWRIVLHGAQRAPMVRLGARRITTRRDPARGTAEFRVPNAVREFLVDIGGGWK